MHPMCTLALFQIKKDSEKLSKSLILLAGATRLELATSGLTGRRSNQTELRPRFLFHLPSETLGGIPGLATFPPPLLTLKSGGRNRA